MITNLIDQLKRDEDNRIYVYDDANGKAIVPGSVVVGHPTIGIGRALDRQGLSDGERSYIFANDIVRVRGALEEHFPWALGLSDARQGVLLNMIFQMGAEGLTEFRSFLQACIKGDVDAAHDAMLDSKWAKVQSPQRATRLSIQYKTGIWQ